MKKAILDLINLIDDEIQVEFEEQPTEYGLACEPEEKVIYIGMRTTPIEEKAFFDYVNELDNEFLQKFPINHYIISILHEVGHCETHEEEQEEEYNFNTELLNTMEEQGFLSKEDQCKFYVRLTLEKWATQWAIEFIKNNYLLCKQFEDRIIKKLC